MITEQQYLDAKRTVELYEYKRWAARTYSVRRCSACGAIVVVFLGPLGRAPMYVEKAA